MKLPLCVVPSRCNSDLDFLYKIIYHNAYDRTALELSTLCFVSFLSPAILTISFIVMFAKVLCSFCVFLGREWEKKTIGRSEEGMYKEYEKFTIYGLTSVCSIEY